MFSARGGSRSLVYWFLPTRPRFAGGRPVFFVVGRFGGWEFGDRGWCERIIIGGGAFGGGGS